MKKEKILYWLVRLAAALIMMQTLFFKFTASKESVYIFTQVGMEPWGRIGVGILELVASILLLINATAWLGAALAFGLMIGAIGMHITLLGIVVGNDHGQLFTYAVIVTVCSSYVLLKNRRKIMLVISHVIKTGK